MRAFCRTQTRPSGLGKIARIAVYEQMAVATWVFEQNFVVFFTASRVQGWVQSVTVFTDHKTSFGKGNMNISFGRKFLAKTIDHSLLHPALTDQGIIEGCQLAKQFEVATVCVKPYSIPVVKESLVRSGVGICAVIAFPHGNSTIKNKVGEAEEAVQSGATEIDMVVNAGKVLGGDWDYVSTEIKAINDAVVRNGAVLKVIFENDYLEDDHIINLCEICGTHRVAFVKTSTGYGFVRQSNGMYSYKGATDHHLLLMRKHCPDFIQIKAAGGIRTLDDMLRVLNLGVTRIGASATGSILGEAIRRGIK